ncbi:MAG: hypothetical protein ACFFE8_16295 [Candidatus Heimdallarchaeota archaeon]
MEIDKRKVPIVGIERLFKKRRMDREEDKKLIRDQVLVERILSKVTGKESSQEEIRKIIEWLEKISKYVPIDSENELEELVKIMVLLSQERAKLNELYDYPGLDLMKRVRSAMIRYLVVLSEIRARQKEYLEHWFTDEYWISEWSRVLLDLSPENDMVKYGFENIKVRDFLFLLELELATADDASKIEKPMVRLQPVENKDAFLIIPTQAAAEEYEVQVNRILKESLTFADWVGDTLRAFKLP